MMISSIDFVFDTALCLYVGRNFMYGKNKIFQKLGNDILSLFCGALIFEILSILEKTSAFFNYVDWIAVIWNFPTEFLDFFFRNMSIVHTATRPIGLQVCRLCASQTICFHPEEFAASLSQQVIWYFLGYLLMSSMYRALGRPRRFCLVDLIGIFLEPCRSHSFFGHVKSIVGVGNI